jgi:single-stranded-DNA-specific exonuclease RecJ
VTAWAKKKVDKNLVRDISRKHNCDLLTAYILVNRGIVSDGEIPYFLSDDAGLLRDPLAFPGMKDAIGRICHAKTRGEKVLIFGDRDADGIAATVILFDCLKRLKMDVSWRIPIGDEPYGLSTKAVEDFAATGGNLIVTVDCGISSVAEIERANELGLSVIVTDHHLPKGELPVACAIVNPKLPCSLYPFSDISGCMVAYKLMTALQNDQSEYGNPEFILKETEYLQLVALGTVADIMPLKDENRVVVRMGLSALNKNPIKGIAELLLVLGLSNKPISTEELSWLLCPVINSAGRMGCPEKAVLLLLEEDSRKRLVLANELKALNEKRKRLGAKTLPLAEKLALENFERFYGKLAVAAGESICRGITGVIANRLIEKLRIPAMVVHLNESLAIGSIRSPGNYDIRLLLEPLDDIILNYGGHEGALGFSIERALWEQYLDRLEIEIESIRLNEIADKDTVEIDAELPHKYISPDIFALLDRFEPYGEGNKPLLFASSGIRILDSAYLGRREPKHIKFILDAGKYKWTAVLWNGREKAGEEFSDGEKVDLLYTFSRNWYKGVERPEIIIKDISKSAKF